MSLAVSDFKAKLTGGGARPNLFKCIIGEPGGIAADFPAGEDVSFMCKGASLPASTIAEIAVPFRGRALKVAGDRTFANWTVTVINDTSFNIRNAFEQWMNGINAHAAGTAESTSPSDYVADMEVHQLDRTGAILKKYTIVGAFPISVAEISLDYGTGEIEEFAVEFAYQYWSADTTS